MRQVLFLYLDYIALQTLSATVKLKPPEIDVGNPDLQIADTFRQNQIKRHRGQSNKVRKRNSTILCIFPALLYKCKPHRTFLSQYFPILSYPCHKFHTSKI